MSREILLQEVQYHQQCIKNSMSILITDDLWSSLVDIIEDIEFKIWKLPTTSSLIFPKIGHLLYELPMDRPIRSMAIKSSSSPDKSSEFRTAAQQEHLCLNTPIDGHNGSDFVIVIGDELETINFNETDLSFIAIPLKKTDYSFVNG